MKPGDTVVCRASRGYHFTTGKEYTVVRHEAECPDQFFTWPAYLTVVDDWGQLATFHAHRFELVT